MTIESSSSSASQAGDEPLTPMQEAIRARALATLENDERQPKPTTRRKVITGVLAVVTVVLILVAIDFAVRIVQHILELYGQEETGVNTPAPFDPNKPIYITVDPQVDTSGTSTPAPPADSGMEAK